MPKRKPRDFDAIAAVIRRLYRPFVEMPRESRLACMRRGGLLAVFEIPLGAGAVAHEDRIACYTYVCADGASEVGGALDGVICGWNIHVCRAAAALELIGVLTSGEVSAFIEEFHRRSRAQGEASELERARELIVAAGGQVRMPERRR